MACSGWPPVSAAPGAHGSDTGTPASVVTVRQRAGLVTGPLSNWPPGVIR